MKNAELLQRSGNGATAFTKRKWTEITEQIQEKAVVGSLLGRTRGYFEWLNRNYIFLSLIQCALANLIAADKIKSADIFVFTRATEDLIDLLLMMPNEEDFYLINYLLQGLHPFGDQR